MGLLFVLENEEHNPSSHVDLGITSYSRIIDRAKKEGNGNNLYPLTRRLSDYYLDAFFAHDELSYLVKELEVLEKLENTKEIREIIELCSLAMSQKKGISVIAD